MPNDVFADKDVKVTILAGRESEKCCHSYGQQKRLSVLFSNPQPTCRARLRI